MVGPGGVAKLGFEWLVFCKFRMIRLLGEDSGAYIHSAYNLIFFPASSGLVHD